MTGHNGHCHGKVRTGTYAKSRMHYDRRCNENNSNKSAGDALAYANTRNSGGPASLITIYRLLRSDPRNLGIGHNWIWEKAEKVDSKFSMIKDHVTLDRTFSKYRMVILTREEWEKTGPIN